MELLRAALKRARWRRRLSERLLQLEDQLEQLEVDLDKVVCRVKQLETARRLDQLVDADGC